MQERIVAVRAKNATKLVAHHAADVVSYDLLEPLQYRGIDAVRQRGQQWFDGYDGPMDYEIVGLQVVAAFDVAFCYGLHHVSGTTRDGQKIDMHWPPPRDSSVSTAFGEWCTSTVRCRST